MKTLLSLTLMWFSFTCIFAQTLWKIENFKDTITHEFSMPDVRTKTTQQIYTISNAKKQLVELTRTTEYFGGNEGYIDTSYVVSIIIKKLDIIEKVVPVNLRVLDKSNKVLLQNSTKFEFNSYDRIYFKPKDFLNLQDDYINNKDYYLEVSIKNQVFKIPSYNMLKQQYNK